MLAYALCVMFHHSFATVTNKKKSQVAVVAFYNVENFFDTSFKTTGKDVAFLTNGEKQYSYEMYYDKITKIATVLSGIATEYTPHGATIIGLTELESDQILEDLVHHNLLEKREYHYIHYTSVDKRGLGVALLYQPKFFKVLASGNLRVKIPTTKNQYYLSRDVLWVKGLLGRDTIYLYVNHWPSKLGGEKKSEVGRKIAALANIKHIDSIARVNGRKKVIVMGDLNEDPVSPAVREIFSNHLSPSGNSWINPWRSFFKKGFGTLAYRDSWNLFDQIILNNCWTTNDTNHFYFYKAKIYRNPNMIECIGNFRGYPMRTWSGNQYRGGYSDHLPVYVVLLQ